MVSSTGKNLSVVIITEPGKDWETFSTWYSIFKNLPDATVAVAIARNQETPFQLFQWAKRLKLLSFHHNRFDPENEAANWIDSVDKAIHRGANTQNMLILRHLAMATDVFDQKLLNVLNERSAVFDRDAWFLKNPDTKDMLNQLLLDQKRIEIEEGSLCIEAKDSTEFHPLASCRKGCGKWIHTLRGCPFSNVNGLMTADMTPNENRIFDLWKRMCSLYNAVA